MGLLRLLLSRMGWEWRCEGEWEDEKEEEGVDRGYKREGKSKKGAMSGVDENGGMIMIWHKGAASSVNLMNSLPFFFFGTLAAII